MLPNNLYYLKGGDKISENVIKAAFGGTLTFAALFAVAKILLSSESGAANDMGFAIFVVLAIVLIAVIIAIAKWLMDM